MLSPAAPAKPTEIRALAGARALPPLLLVLYHYHEGHGYQHLRLFDVFVAKGYLWVEFFFALSGFVLTHVYGSRVRAVWTAKGYGEFLRNRLARLYPVHFAMLTVILVMMVTLRALALAGGYISVFDLPGYHPHTEFSAFIANLFLVQAWHLFPFLSWNGVAWFVSVEFFLCLVFPLWLLLARGGMLRAALLMLAGFATLYGLAQTSGHGLDITYDWGIIRGLADFSIGVGMAMLYRDLRARADSVPESVFTALQGLVFAGFLAGIYLPGWSHHAGDFWTVPGMTLLILAIAFDRGALSRLIGSAPLRRLGEWSYAIYMGQTTWLMLLRFAEQRLYPGTAGAPWVHIVEPIGLVIVCTLWGIVLYVAVEQPASRFLRRRGGEAHRAPS